MSGTRRTPINRPPHPVVTQRAVKLFRYGLQLQSEGKDDSDLFNDVDRQLHRELGLRPWHDSVFHVTIDDPWPPTRHALASHRQFWEHIKELRRQLVGAAMPQ
jgi:hypothetical protein